MLSSESLELLITCTARYLNEVVRPNAPVIAFTGGNPRKAERALEDVIDQASHELQVVRKREAEMATAAREVVADQKPEPKTNREKIAAAIEEAAAAGVPNA